MISTTPMTAPRMTSSSTRPTERRADTADGPAGECESMRASLPTQPSHLSAADAMVLLFVLVTARGRSGRRFGLVYRFVWPRPGVGFAFFRQLRLVGHDLRDARTADAVRLTQDVAYKVVNQVLARRSTVIAVTRQPGDPVVLAHHHDAA